jgi:hypothetical protein
VPALHFGNARLQRDTTVGVIAREVLEQRLLVQREQIGRLREEYPFYRTLGWPVDEGGRVSMPVEFKLHHRAHVPRRFWFSNGLPGCSRTLGTTSLNWHYKEVSAEGRTVRIFPWDVPQTGAGCGPGLRHLSMFRYHRKRIRDGHADSPIGPSTEIHGDVRLTGGRVIFGTVFGNVVSEVDNSCLVHLSESGRVEGETRVPNVLVNGVVSGNVFSTEICS